MMENIRIGHGYDVHALATGLPLIIGGVEMEFEKGCVAHSDGDVLLHAVCDALLGAAAMGDIGLHFPDTSEEFRGADSARLLSRVAELITREGYRILNIDSTVILQKPKLRPYIDAMRRNIARAAGLDPAQVNVKATTEENLGFTGSGQGVASHAVALIIKDSGK